MFHCVIRKALMNSCRYVLAMKQIITPAQRHLSRWPWRPCPQSWLASVLPPDGSFCESLQPAPVKQPHRFIKSYRFIIPGLKDHLFFLICCCSRANILSFFSGHRQCIPSYQSLYSKMSQEILDWGLVDGIDKEWLRGYMYIFTPSQDRLKINWWPLSSNFT